MRRPRKKLLSRKRLLKAAVFLMVVVVCFWLFGRVPLARWVVARTFDSMGLQPATFDVDSVSIRSIQLNNISIGEATWFTSDNITVRYSISDLLAQRVSIIDINDAHWKVRTVDGEFDWGYVPPPRDDAKSKPLSLELPFDRLNAKNAIVEFAQEDDIEEIPVTLSIATGGETDLTGTLELLYKNWQGQFAVTADSSSDELILEIDGKADSTISDNKSRLTLKAGASKAHTEGVLQFDATMSLENFAQQLQNTSLVIQSAQLTTHARIAGDSTIENFNVLLTAKKIRFNNQLIKQFDLTASTPDDSEDYSLKNLPLVLDLAVTSDGWEMPAAAGKVVVNKQSDATVFTIGMTTTQPVSYKHESASIDATIRSLAAGMKVTLENSETIISDGKLSMTQGTVRAGDLTLSDARFRATMPSIEEINVNLLDAVLNEGSAISASPFAFNPASPMIATRVNVSNLTLEHWLPIMTDEKATGEGRVSGYVDLAIDFTADTPRVAELNGFLKADPEHGYIQVTDAEAVGELLDKQDPRFATDEVMKPVRDKIVSALRDFSFNKLSVDFSREGDVTSAIAYLSGQGRTGPDPQGVNLTLDLTAEDAFVNAYLRLAERFSIKQQAQEALDGFFSGAAAPDVSEEAE